jgi:hypothetical protein
MGPAGVDTTCRLCNHDSMIPPFRANGLLPPGIHEARDWAEVVEQFGGTPEREELLAKLRQGLDNLRDAGCSWVLLDGSFVTTKPNPHDVDGCWDYGPLIDRKRLDPCFLPRSVAQKQMLKLRYGMDFYRASSIEGDSGKRFIEFFQTDRAGTARAIVLLNLAAELDRQR